MKKHWANVALLLIAVPGMVSFGILVASEKSVLKWVPALLLSILFAGVAIGRIR